MTYQMLIEKLRKERDKLAAETHRRIEKMNQAIMALDELNGKDPRLLEAKGAEPIAHEDVEPKPVKKRKATMVIKKHERAGDILRRIGMHYRDVAIDAARKAGRPVTTEEVFMHLRKLSGKNLTRKTYMPRIGVCLRYEALHNHLLQTRVPGGSRRESLWNAVSAADLQKQEIVSADIK